jgi:hypothetical protein
MKRKHNSLEKYFNIQDLKFGLAIDLVSKNKYCYCEPYKPLFIKNTFEIHPRYPFPKILYVKHDWFKHDNF